MEAFIVSKLFYIACSTWLSLILWEIKAVGTSEKRGQGLIAELVQLPAHVPSCRAQKSVSE